VSAGWVSSQLFTILYNLSKICQNITVLSLCVFIMNTIMQVVAKCHRYLHQENVTAAPTPYIKISCSGSPQMSLKEWWYFSYSTTYNDQKIMSWKVLKKFSEQILPKGLSWSICSCNKWLFTTLLILHYYQKAHEY